MEDKITKRIRLLRDECGEWDYDDLIKIAYLNRARNCLGTESVTRERMDGIRDAIAKGEYIGMPVYAYVHSGATISTSPFSCPWDSGQSGFVYVTRKDAVENWGKKLLTAKVRETALAACESWVKAFATYLEEGMWGFVAEELEMRHVKVTSLDKTEVLSEYDEETWEQVDSCWGFVGCDWKTNGMEDHIGHLLKDGFVMCEEAGG
jgi:hypothetical protein